MNYVMSEDGSTSRDPVYICIAESQLNAVMNNLESAKERCALQSLAMVTAGHDLRQHIQIIRAALENLGYRQLTVWWRLRGIVSYIRGKRSWGKMHRKGFNSVDEEEADEEYRPVQLAA